MTAYWHFPPVAGFPPARGRGRDRSEPLFGKPDRRQTSQPVTLCGLVSSKCQRWVTTRAASVDCPRCRKLLERYPQLGNHLVRGDQPGTLATAIEQEGAA